MVALRKLEVQELACKFSKAHIKREMQLLDNSNHKAVVETS